MLKCELPTHFITCGSFKLVWKSYYFPNDVESYHMIALVLVSVLIGPKNWWGNNNYYSTMSMVLVSVWLANQVYQWNQMSDWFVSQYQVFKVAISFTFAPHPSWVVKINKEPCEFNWFWLLFSLFTGLFQRAKVHFYLPVKWFTVPEPMITPWTLVYEPHPLFWQ